MAALQRLAVQRVAALVHPLAEDQVELLAEIGIAGIVFLNFGYCTDTFLKRPHHPLIWVAEPEEAAIRSDGPVDCGAAVACEVERDCWQKETWRRNGVGDEEVCDEGHENVALLGLAPSGAPVGRSLRRCWRHSGRE